MEHFRRAFPGLLILCSIALALYFIHVATLRDLTRLELIFFQLFILVASLVGSYLSGSREAERMARKLVEGQARPAFRRIMSLYKSISHVAYVVSSNSYAEDDSSKLNIVRAIAEEQINTADDALEDWKDIAPGLVDQTKTQIRTHGEQRD